MGELLPARGKRESDARLWWEHGKQDDIDQRQQIDPKGGQAEQESPPAPPQGVEDEGQGGEEEMDGEFDGHDSDLTCCSRCLNWMLMRPSVIQTHFLCGEYRKTSPAAPNHKLPSGAANADKIHLPA